MKKRRKVKRKLNNTGMTLIEILVAMAILIIAIIPLSAGYIYSAKNSVKAKHMQQTSVLAHTMIENCKAYSLTKIIEKVDADSFVPNTTMSDYTFDSTTGEYKCFFDDVVVYEDISGGQSNQVYDLYMRIKPIDSAKKKIMLYNNMNKYTDAFFMAGTTTSTAGLTASQVDAAAYDYLLGKIQALVQTDAATHTGRTLVNNDVGSIDTSLKSGINSGIVEIQRTIDIKTADTGSEQAKVVYSYTYDFSSNFTYKMADASGNLYPYTVSCSSLEGSSGAPAATEFLIYSNSISGVNAALKDVYIFYYPSYNNVGIKYKDDIIQMSNHKEINVYLMKQYRTEMSEAEVRNAEASYDPKINGSGVKVKLYHNLRENLGGGSGAMAWAPPAVSLDIEYQDSDPTSGIESLIVEDDKQLMYTVEVSIHPSDSYQLDVVTGTMSMTKEALSSMDGTFLDW